MNKLRVLMLVSLVLFEASASLAQVATAKGTDETTTRSGAARALKPQLNKAQEAAITQLRQQVLTTRTQGPCTQPIAVSVAGFGHFTAGVDVLLPYSSVITNVGGAWSSTTSTFVAPCNGIFYFNVTFVKDAFYHNGTTDDVTVYITRNNSFVGEAWSGEGAGMRGTGAYGVTLVLNKGDWVNTMVHSDGNPMRHLAEYNFTGFLIR